MKGDRRMECRPNTVCPLRNGGGGGNNAVLKSILSTKSLRFKFITLIDSYQHLTSFSVFQANASSVDCLYLYSSLVLSLKSFQTPVV